MKTFLIILVLLVTAIIVYFFVLGIQSKAKEAPGLTAEQLRQCPDTPNCICTEYPEHHGHYLAPITLPRTLPAGFDSIATAREIIIAMAGKIHQQSNHYLAATFTSAFFGFVDDFEIRIDPENQVMHLRSASRVGHSDLGVNKKRIEDFKQRFEKEIASK